MRFLRRYRASSRRRQFRLPRRRHALPCRCRYWMRVDATVLRAAFAASADASHFQISFCRLRRQRHF